MLDVIQSLWVGDKLSPLEQMCIKSYLRMGHPFHLYSYQKVAGVPEGVTTKSANEIIPRWKIDAFQNLANFSDFFRFLLLYKKGGWWTDLDVFCLQPFEFTDPYVFAKQLSSKPGHPEEITTCIMKAFPLNDLCRHCIDRIVETNTMTCGWADIGPELLIQDVPAMGLEKYARSKWVFCPIDHFDAPNAIFGPDSGMQCVGDAYAIHLWNEEARRAGIDKWGFYPGSLFNNLKMKVDL